MEITPVHTMFLCGDYPCEHYFYVPLLIAWQTIARDAHCNITMGNDFARDIAMCISQCITRLLRTSFECE